MKPVTLAHRASLLAAAVALALPLAATAQNIATVNGKPVPKSRVDALLTQAAKQGQQKSPELEKQARDAVVLREMFMQEAEKKGIAATPEFKAQMDFARQTILINELFADFQKKNPVSDAEVKAEYDKAKVEFDKAKAQAAQNPNVEYRARHILVEKEDEAKALIAQIKGGASFEDLAKKNSKDPGSGAKGGDLDFANPKAYVPEFSEALMKLKKGEMTDAPVKSQFGWHIIRLEETREAQADPREERFPTLAEVEPQIKQNLSQQKLGKYRDEIKAKSKTDYPFN